MDIQDKKTNKRTADAFELNEALMKTCLTELDDYIIVEGNGFKYRCLFSAFTDILFGLYTDRLSLYH